VTVPFVTVPFVTVPFVTGTFSLTVESPRTAVRRKMHQHPLETHPVTENPYESPTVAPRRDDVLPIGLGWYLMAALEAFFVSVAVLAICFLLTVVPMWPIRFRFLVNDPVHQVFWLSSLVMAIALGLLRAVHSVQKSRTRAARRAALVQERISAVRALKQRSGLAEKDESN